MKKLALSMAKSIRRRSMKSISVFLLLILLSFYIFFAEIKFLFHHLKLFGTHRYSYFKDSAILIIHKNSYWCPSSTIDVRLRPDSPVILSVDHLQPFTIVKQFTWKELFNYWSKKKLPPLNFSTASQFSGFPAFLQLNASLRHWTISPKDPGIWYLLSAHERLLPNKNHEHDYRWYGGFQKATYRLQDFISDSSNQIWTFVDMLQHSEQRVFQPCSESYLPKQQMMNSQRSRQIFNPLRFLIVSMSTTKTVGTGFSRFAAIRTAYSKLFNYTFELNFVQHKSRRVEYLKIDVLMKYYRKYSKVNEFDYLFWMDWDTCIMNRTVTLESFIPVSLPDIIMTDHDQAINNGGFFLRLRGVPRVGRFLQFWKKQSELADWLWWDNGSMYPSLIVYLDRDPDYKNECGYDNTIRCLIEQILSVKYKLPYGRRISQYLYCIPARIGFNNHHFSVGESYNWDPTTTYYPDKGMFVIHDKAEDSWGNLSEKMNGWNSSNITSLPWVDF